MSVRDVAILKMVQLEAEMHGVMKRVTNLPRAPEIKAALRHFDPGHKPCGASALWDDRIGVNVHQGVVAVRNHVEEWMQRHGGEFAETQCQYRRLTSHRRLALVKHGKEAVGRVGILCDDTPGMPHGDSLANVDVELLLYLREIFSSPNIFIIGNGHGYGTMVVAYIFLNGRIDVLTLGGSPCLEVGIDFAREFLEQQGVQGQVVEGTSPQGTASVAEGKLYDIVFIDGDHNFDSVVADFKGIEQST
eukprot:gnl/MRDRNA2_/MRDRNA2_14679_c0_seq1.p1 gnl/MRDRNA2_/MRDRNA2_14679_c0~~gnl/MRDRNA2_/MRDRNA2_14679_c0_seq1.p1  ORF type:complete len:283 (-),score=49.95 gnl/MRDRNA2_/MRDRNA2_14679_c0_seq1:41-781(-)